MPAYCVYAFLPENIEKLALDLRLDNTDDRLLWTMDEVPHVTVMYGPMIDDNTDELNSKSSKSEINTLLGGFISKYEGAYPSFKISGIGCFYRDDKNIIKLNIESSDMTEMQVFLRKNTENTYEVMHEKNPHDQSYAMPPIGWCHVTLGYLKKNVDVVPIIKELSERLEFALEQREFSVRQIALISAKTDQIIKLW